MNSKMTWGGIGPKIGLISLPYIILCGVIIEKDKNFLAMYFLNNTFTNVIGYFLFLTGIIFLAATAYTFLKGFTKGQLVTRGTYNLCRNPIYASWILFIIPGLAFILQSGLILTISIVIYINFKIAIHGEYILLRNNFGEEYHKYETEVNELIPFPRFLNKTES